jgi:hypothetical protein
VHAEALAVMVAVTADFMFNRWDLEILPYYLIRQIPWCVRYHAQSLRLQAFNYFYVGRGCGSPELYCIGPVACQDGLSSMELIEYIQQSVGHLGRLMGPLQASTCIEQHKHRINTHIYISMPWVGFESTTPAFGAGLRQRTATRIGRA